MSKNKSSGITDRVENESEKQGEIAEIQLRIRHLQDTDQISISDKITIAKQALEILEKDKELERKVQ